MDFNSKDLKWKIVTFEMCFPPRHIAQLNQKWFAPFQVNILLCVSQIFSLIINHLFSYNLCLRFPNGKKDFTLDV
jgi:hypothetical protein